MRIAVTYDNGSVFQHFGRTESFKIYEVEGDKIISSEIIGSDGAGHGALAGVLAGRKVDLLICGGIGGGAQNALAAAGIALCAGAQGDADRAVEAYLRGELVNTGANCDHHHGEDHDCHGHHGGEGDDHECCGGHGGEGDDHECCGGHGGEGDDHECCGGHGEAGHEGREGGCCCGGRGAGFAAAMQGIQGRNVGKSCKVHYRGTFNDGKQFDSSYDRGEPLAFVCGAGMMIRGFDAAVADMEVGEVKDIHLMPEEAYGPSDPDLVFTADISMFPGSEDLDVGDKVYLSSGGQPFLVTVTEKTEDQISFDANHEMAGKELNFRIELVSVNG